MAHRKKIVLFGVIFTFLLAFVILHHPLICMGAKSYLSSRLPRGGKLTFEYKTAHIEAGQFILHDVVIRRLEKEGSPGFDVQVDDLKFAFDFQLFPFHFKPKVVVDHPQVDLVAGDIRAVEKKKTVYQLLDKHLFRTPIKIRQGELHFGEQVAFLSFESPEEGKAGSLKLSKEIGADTGFSATFSKEGQELSFAMDFKSLDLPWVFEMGRYFFPALSPEIKVQEGKVEGSLSLSLSNPNTIDYVKYHIDLTALTLVHEKYGVQLDLHHIGWKEHFATKQELGEMGSHAFFEKVWPYFIGDGELSGLKITIGDSEETRHWEMADVRGGLRFSKQNAPFVHLYGTFSCDQRDYPFQLTGEGFIEDEEFWKIAADLNLQGEDKTRAYVAFTSRGEHRYLLQTEFAEVNTDLLGLFHHLTAIQVPKAQALKVEKGIFAGKMQGWIEDKKLKRLEVIHFLSKEVQATFPSQALVCRADEVSGKGEFDFSTPDFFDGTFWELAVVEGKIQTQREQQVDHLCCHISMHDQYIKPSKLACWLKGVKGEVLFEGLYTHLNLNMGIELFPEAFSEFMGLKKSKALKEPIALDVNIHLKTVQERMTVEGLLTCLHGEKQKDTVQFGWNWNLAKLWMGGFQEALDLGWFKAVDLSDHTLNIPLLLGNRNWRGEGKVNLDGTFNAHAVEFSLDPTDLIYRSSAVDIMPNPKKEGKAPSCTFNFDFKEKNWRGKIPLKGAKLLEHSFGLEFDSFTSEVDLEREEFLFQNVDAYSQGVRFQAEMALDYKDSDQSELTINTYQIDGEAHHVMGFLRHFELFKTLNLPLQGTIRSGPGEMRLRAYVGERGQLLEWKIALHFQEGRYPFSKTLAFENLAGDLYYSAEDQLFKIKKAEGQLLLCAGEKPKSYELNIPLLELDAGHGCWNYDVRLEAPTHDICRIVGTALKEDKELEFLIDHEHSRLFGAKMDVSKLSFTEEGLLSQVEANMLMSSLDLFHHVDFLSSAGLMPLKPIFVHEMRTPQFEGETKLAFSFNRGEERLTFKASSDHLLCGPLNLDHLAIHMERNGDHIILDQFEAGSLAMRASMDKDQDVWSMPQFEVNWKSCHLKGGKGSFNEKEKKLKLPLEGLKVQLEELKTLFPLSALDWSYLTGTLFATGELTFDLSKGLRNLSFDSAIKMVGENFGRGKLRLESSDTLHLSFDLDQGFEMKEANFNFLHPRSNQHWAKCHFDALAFVNQEWKGENFILIVPPEMIQFLGQTRSLPHLGYEEERLMLFDHPVRWDNQIEATMDFIIGKESQAKGHLKEGYYWIGDKAWYLNDFAFVYEKGAFDLNLNTLFDEHPFDLKAHLSFLPHLTSKIVIQETFREERGSGKPLVINTGWNEQEGFYIRNIEGQVCGLDFDFHHNPRESFLDRAVLSGQLKVNVPTFVKLLPKEVQEAVQTFEIGKGYELSGDLTLSKLNFEDSHFIGYLKGKNFQLMGSVMGTLLSEIAIHPHNIELTKFNVSDASGIFKMESIRIEQMPDARWHLVIPELAIQDFRPSLLKKIGKYPGRIKPLTIRELYFRNIRGYLGEAKSFTGKGELNFINTFKRDYNLLDIPFEILGRLGLDMGLLVPVRGDLNFIMVDGRIYLTELKGSYSEGKRSQFFISPSQPSYVDFDGNLNINIKMKQYVLLKITEPFTLSIAGTFENPKYGLK
ncbi:MAG: hypothetical protein AB7N99_09625 [Simkaniaceae bacterium]